MSLYYEDTSVTLYHGNCREVLPSLGQTFDAAICDPPYGETSLPWDRWPDGWPAAVAAVTRSMWCFGSMRMFLERRDEFTDWKLSQDVVWEKPHGSGIAADRFRRVHEHVAHWYHGPWVAVHHVVPRSDYSGPDSRHGYTRHGSDGHTGALRPGYRWTDDGTRLMRSVLKAPTMWRRGGVHPTQKPVELLTPLIEYAVPSGGNALDPFAGSGATAVAARLAGRRCVLIEAHEPYCELIARRLDQDVLTESTGGAS